jgi:cytochrome P450
VKKGWKVFMDLHVGHHGPPFFKDPLEFQPFWFEVSGVQA